MQLRIGSRKNRGAANSCLLTCLLSYGLAYIQGTFQGQDASSHSHCLFGGQSWKERRSDEKLFAAASPFSDEFSIVACI
jgi:hypothetical protein